jgi:hypothetical protein
MVHIKYLGSGRQRTVGRKKLLKYIFFLFSIYFSTQKEQIIINMTQVIIYILCAINDCIL